MTIFIVQGRYTQQGLKGLVDKPEDRMAEVRALVERAGAKLLGYYVTFGDYDWMTISEGDNPVKTLGTLAASGSGSGLTDFKTTIAFSSADAKRAFQYAHDTVAQFRQPGQ